MVFYRWALSPRALLTLSMFSRRPFLYYQPSLLPPSAMCRKQAGTTMSIRQTTLHTPGNVQPTHLCVGLQLPALSQPHPVLHSDKLLSSPYLVVLSSADVALTLVDRKYSILNFPSASIFQVFRHPSISGPFPTILILVAYEVMSLMGRSLSFI
ncbi:hypothetical protein BJX99DRAFT_231726 [Aspergillus californicus]